MTVLLLTTLGTLATATAGPIYRCQTPAGVVEYSNSAPADAQAKRCQKIELPNINTIPAPAHSKAGGAAPGNAKSGNAFPAVSPESQKARDNDRARILQDELKREEERLASLKTTFNNGQPERNGDERNFQKYLDRVEKMRSDIASHESNVGALRRELDVLKD